MSGGERRRAVVVGGRSAAMSPTRRQVHPSPSSAVDLPSKHFTVSVVGLSGTEREKGAVGSGKSCLCNRFVRPAEDDYSTDHISTLSQVDFSGSPVINNDHWLYWGDRTLAMGVGDSVEADTSTAPQTAEWTFRVIEQTEFVDDESFQILAGSGPAQKEAYHKRAVTSKLHSPDKLMYLCKGQLGLEAEYEQRALTPEGRVDVDGFVCVYDVSVVPKRTFQQQSDFVAKLLQQIRKVIKKPVVLAATKMDDACAEGGKECERLLARKEVRPLSIPFVESSSHRDVNIEAAFVLLGHLIEKIKNKPRILPFAEANLSRQQKNDGVKTAYVNLLRAMLPAEQLEDRRITWNQLLNQYGLLAEPIFQHFCHIFGRVHAQRLYKQYTAQIRERNLKRRLEARSAQLPSVLAALIPDPSVAPIRGRQWADVLQWLLQRSDLHDYFAPVGSLSDGSSSADGGAAADRRKYDDQRLPVELLYTSDAEICYRNHVNNVESQRKNAQLRDDFERLLIDCTHVTPGKPLSDVEIFLMGQEAFESISKCDAQGIYDQYQWRLIKRAKEDFEELLLESVHAFVERILFRNGGTAISGIANKDMKEIKDLLEEDPRYRLLNRLYEMRDDMISRYASFVAYPLRQHCPAAVSSGCAEDIIEQIISNRSNRLTSSIENGALLDDGFGSLRPLTFTLLGSSRLPDQLIREIRLYLPDEVYHASGSGTYQLNYRILDYADVVQRRLNLLSAFSSDGGRRKKQECLVMLYSSRETLNYIREAVTTALLTNAASTSDVVQTDFVDVRQYVVDGALGQPGLSQPAVIVLAGDPNHLEDLPYLHQQGALLADSLQVPFVGVGGVAAFNRSPQRNHPQNGVQGLLLFSQQQIIRLMEASCAQVAAKCDETSAELRVAVCLMCGDDFNVDAVVGCLLNDGHNSDLTAHSANKTSSPMKQKSASSTTVDILLPSLARKVAVELVVSSYHSAYSVDFRQIDGAIFAYSTHRRASLSHLNSVVRSKLPNDHPLMILAVGELTDFFSDRSTNALMTEGNELADRLQARFATSKPHLEQQIGSYTTFLEEVFRYKQQRLSNDDAVGTIEESHYASLSEFRSGYWSTEDSKKQTPAPEMSESVVMDDSDEDVSEDDGHRWGYSSSMRKALRNTESARNDLWNRGGSTEPTAIDNGQQHPLSNLPWRTAATDGPTSVTDPAELGIEFMTVTDTENDVYASVESAVMSGDGSGGGQVQANSFPGASDHSSDQLSSSTASDTTKESPSTLNKSSPKQRPPVKLKQMPTVPPIVARRKLRKSSNDEPEANESSKIGPGIAAKLRQLNEELLFPGLPATAAIEQRRQEMMRSSDRMVRSASDESIFESVHKKKELKKSSVPVGGGRTSSKGAELVKRMRSSFRFRRSKRLTAAKTVASNNETHSPSPACRSLPHSPLMQRSLTVLSSSELGADRRGGIVFASPPVAPTTFDSSILDVDSLIDSSGSRPSTSSSSVGGGSNLFSPPSSATTVALSAAPSSQTSATGWSYYISNSSSGKTPRRDKSSGGAASFSVGGTRRSSSDKLPGGLGGSLVVPPGTKLADLVSASPTRVPLFVRACVEFIESEGGLRTEGLYRVPGNQSHVTLLERRFAENPSVSFKDLDLPVNAVATALKNFFSCLAAPVVPHECWCEVADQWPSSGRLSADHARLRAVMARCLPSENAVVLRYLTAHLRCVAENADVTSMDTRNLAKCFWPTLLRPDFDSFESMAQLTPKFEEFTQTLIMHADQLLPPSDDDSG